MKKKLLALLLTSFMIVSLLPAAALAAEKTIPSRGGNLTAGDYVLDSDLEISSTLVVKAGSGNTVTIDLKGHVLKKNGGTVIGVSTGNLILKDSDPTTEHAGYVDNNGLWIWDKQGTHQLQAGEIAKNIKGGIITGGSNTGGGISISAGDFTMNGGTICGNKGTNGAGIYSRSSGNLSINGGSICYNTASNVGGGIYNAADCTISLNNCSISNNTAGQYGGAFMNTKGSVTATNCEFIGNKVTGTNKNGGAFQNQGGESLTFTDCVFSGNTADRGGAIYSTSGSISITDCTFTENTVSTSGAGIYIQGATDKEVNIIGGEFSRNTAGDQAGAIYNGSKKGLNISDCTIIDNSVGNSGGGITNQGDMTITNCLFSGNSANHGGGIDNNAPGYVVTLNGCTFTDNEAKVTAFEDPDQGRGGGIFLWDGEVRITDCIFTDNKALNAEGGKGGGVYISQNITADELVLGGDVKINDNIAGTEENTHTDNLYFLEDSLITLGDGTNGVKVPTAFMSVGVTTEVKPTLSAPIKFTSNGSDDDLKYFFSDRTDYYVDFNSGSYLELKAPDFEKYTINVISNGYGTVKASAKEAAQNDEIALNVNADTGYRIKTLTVTDANGENVSVTDNSFNMPANGVIVMADFEEMPETVYSVEVATVGKDNQGIQAVTEEDLGTIRFGWTLTYDGEKPSSLGACIINWGDFDDTEKTPIKTNVSSPDIASGGIFYADITDIPENAWNTTISAYPFVNGEAFADKKIEGNVTDSIIWIPVVK